MRRAEPTGTGPSSRWWKFPGFLNSCLSLSHSILNS